MLLRAGRLSGRTVAVLARVPARGCRARPPVRRFSQPPTTTPPPVEASPAAAGAKPTPPPLPEVEVLQPPPGSSRKYEIAAAVIGVLIGYVGAVGVDTFIRQIEDIFRGDSTEKFSSGHSVTNWSGTHTVEPHKYFEPESVQELVRLVGDAQVKGQRLRPVGTALSPNGLGMSEEAMVSVAHLDKVLNIDTANLLVTVEAGARVSQVLEALSKHGLTLQNFSSVQEQQMGGWTQVAAHGTGARLPTVEEQIVSMKVVTPAKGMMELNNATLSGIFQYAKVGLGALGIVSELTLKCVPQHKLLERTYVTTPKQLRKDHARLLKEYRHVRYMWIPHTDTVVVVVSNEHKEGDPLPKDFDQRVPEDKKLAHVRQLLLSHRQNKVPREQVEAMSFTTLRDQLLDLAPLDHKHVARVNAAEAKYWSMSQGWRLDDSTNILGFDCGGQQLVLEVAFDIGKLHGRANGPAPDLDFVEKALKRIKDAKLPAPAPIEQRWTASSSASMSPAFSDDPERVFSWVGIIMYLPPGQGPEGRDAITQRFDEYVKALEPLYEEYGAVPHWAKVELPAEPERLARLKERIHHRYQVPVFNTARKFIDPKGLMSNKIVDTLMPME